MSFTSDLKSKMCAVSEEENACCKTAQAAAILAFSGSLTLPSFKIRTENEYVAHYAAEIFFALTKKRPVFTKNGSSYVFDGRADAYEALFENITFSENGTLGFENSIFKNDCCKKSFVRAAFLFCGSMSDPKKSYHVEFVTGAASGADFLYELLLDMGVLAKMTVRKNSFVIYIKDSESIASLLGIMGASGAMMDFYNIKIEREIMNKVNRQLNCDEANFEKSYAASRRHLAAIEKISHSIGIDALPKPLSQMCRVRLSLPEATLKELGEALDPPIGKSGVNHRLEKICAIADEIKA